MNDTRQSKRMHRRGKGLGALAVVGIIAVAAPKAAHADAVVNAVGAQQSHALSSFGLIARAIIAQLLQNQTTAASVSKETTAGAKAPPSCNCMRAGNGKGAPTKIACDGSEAREAKAAGTLIKTCSQ